MKTFYIVFFALVFVLLLAFYAQAQPSNPVPPFLPSNPAQAPIDGGLGLLAAAGGAYAWKKLRRQRTD